MSGHAAVEVAGDIVLFGGINIAAGEIYHAIYVFRPGTCEWVKPKVTGEVPEQRNSHAMVSLGRTVILFGGSSPDDGPMNDLYALACPEDVAGGEWQWRQLGTRGPAPMPREMHSMFLYPSTAGAGAPSPPVAPSLEPSTSSAPTSTPSSEPVGAPSEGGDGGADSGGAGGSHRDVASSAGESGAGAAAGGAAEGEAAEEKGEEGVPAGVGAGLGALQGRPVPPSPSPLSGTLCLYGGRGEDGVLDDVCELDLDTLTWYPAVRTGHPRCAVAGCALEGAKAAAVVFGGWDGGVQVFDSALQLTRSGAPGSSWRAVVRPMSRPVPNRFAAAGAGCATPASGAHALAVFGGCNFEGDCGDVLVVTTQAV